MSAWRAILDGPGTPLERVEAARDRGLAAPAEAVAELAALAFDGALPAVTRVLALGALARIAVHGGVRLPDLSDVVGDEAVIAAALAVPMPDALTAVVSQLPDGTYARIVRKLVGYRLIAAGVRGPHVSRVLVDAGELDGAARAIADDFQASLRPAVRQPSRTALAWAEALAAQLDRHGAALAEPLRACLLRHDGAIDAMLALLERVDGGAAARALLGRRTEAN